jgi:hypothetical protein
LREHWTVAVSRRHRVPSPYRSLSTVPLFIFLGTSSVLGQIQDNSFLIEEAYNQEPGVVQHISNLASRFDGDAWFYSLTQEWPLGGIQNQFSYTIPVLNDASGTGLGDVLLNYRYQLLGNAEAPVAFAPRISLVLPTGNDEQGRGAGAVGLQANMPLSVVLSRQLVTHWNVGGQIIPSAKGAAGFEATTTSFNLGGSAVWLLHPSLNLLLEGVWLSTESVSGGGTERDDAMLLNPGLRGAINFGNLQIVPGFAYTINASSDSSEDDAFFLYLSFEHPFKH